MSVGNTGTWLSNVLTDELVVRASTIVDPVQNETRGGSLCSQSLESTVFVMRPMYAGVW